MTETFTEFYITTAYYVKPVFIFSHLKYDWDLNKNNFLHILVALIWSNK